MKFINRILKAVKKCFKFIADVVKGKDVGEVISDTSKVVTAMAVTGLTVKATIDGMRVRAMQGPEKVDVYNTETPAEYMMKQRTGDGSIIDRLNELKAKNRNIGKRNVKENANLDKGGSNLLKRIAATRNEFFNSLSETDQIAVLRSEGFDCKAFLAEEERKSWGFFTRIWKRITQANRPMKISSTDAVLKNDYSYLCFTDKIRRFFHIEPKHEIPQIELFPEWHIAKMKCTNIAELKQYAQIACKYMPKSDIDKYVHSPEVVTNGASSMEKRHIIADELFKAKTYKKFKKRVDDRMADAGIVNTKSVFEMMTEYEKDNKKKKKKKKGKKNKDSYDDYRAIFDYDEPKKGKKKKNKKKKNVKSSDSYAKDARQLYLAYLDTDRKGKLDYEGKWFD